LGPASDAALTYRVRECSGIGAPYTVAPATVSVGASGGTGQITVTAAAGCGWTASSDAAWTTVAATATDGPGAVDYTVTANATGTARSATLMVAGQAVSLQQPPPSPTLTLSTTAAPVMSTVTVTVANGPAHVGDWVALYAVGDTAYLSWKYLNDTTTLPATGLAAATVALAMPATPGSYVVRLHWGATLLATSETITVTSPMLTVSATAAAPLGIVTATVANGPGHVGDWVGLYAAGGTTFLDWRYLNGTQTLPTTGVGDGTVGFTMPATPGSYVVRFSCETVLATSPSITVAGVGFTVSATTAVPLATVTATIANGPGTVGDRVDVYAAGGTTPVDWRYLNGAQTAPATGLTGATIPFTMPIMPGLYTLRFSSSAVLLATSLAITVALPANAATLTSSATAVATLGTVTATIANGPGQATDWVALYPTGGTMYLDWKYLNGSRTAPATGATGGTVTFTMPITPGSYTLLFSTGTTGVGDEPTDHGDESHAHAERDDGGAAEYHHGHGRQRPRPWRGLGRPVCRRRHDVSGLEIFERAANASGHRPGRRYRGVHDAGDVRLLRRTTQLGCHATGDERSRAGPIVHEFDHAGGN
jgi:hypothetical protein